MLLKDLYKSIKSRELKRKLRRKDKMTTQTLTLSQCKEYVKNIKDLEVSCYQQEQLLGELKRQPSVTQKRISELEHQLRTEKEPEKPLGSIGNSIASGVAVIFVPLLGALIGVVCALVIRCICGVIGFFQNVASQSTGFLSFIWEFFTMDIDSGMPSWLTFIFWGAVIGYGLHFILMLIGVVGSRGENKEERKTYPQKVELFHKKQQEISHLIEDKKKSLQTTIPHEITKREQQYQQTKQLLKKYYDMGFIYPKYRGLVPICTICEYLESGRCFSLLGHEGAYNLYESELRMNMIIGKLDDVINRLDDISANQRMLAQELRKSNAQLQRISGTLDNIENNTALTQYYSSVTASNTTFMSWLAAFDYDERAKG